MKVGLVNQHDRMNIATIRIGGSPFRPLPASRVPSALSRSPAEIAPTSWAKARNISQPARNSADAAGVRACVAPVSSWLRLSLARACSRSRTASYFLSTPHMKPAVAPTKLIVPRGQQVASAYSMRRARQHRYHADYLGSDNDKVRVSAAYEFDRLV